MWTVLAEGSPDEFEQQVPPIDELEAGTKLRLRIYTTIPIAPIVELWGADWVFQQMLGSGVIVTDVYAPKWNEVVIDMTVTGTPIIPIIIAIAVVLSVGGIAWIVHNLRLMAEIAGPAGTTLLIAGGILALALLGYAVYKTEVLGKIPKPKLKEAKT